MPECIRSGLNSDPNLIFPCNFCWQNCQAIAGQDHLGKGEIYYFVCSFTLKRCKILYSGYGSHYFKSREAYKNRIYYASQLSSHLDRHNDQYWRLDKEIQRLREKQVKRHYKGQETALQERINRLTEERDYHEKMRWIIVPKAVAKFMGAKGLSDARYLL